MVRTQVGLANCQCLLCRQRAKQKGCTGTLRQIVIGLFCQQGWASSVFNPSSLLPKAFLLSLKVAYQCTPCLMTHAPGTLISRAELLFLHPEPVLSEDASPWALCRLLPSTLGSASSVPSTSTLHPNNLGAVAERAKPQETPNPGLATSFLALVHVLNVVLITGQFHSTVRG